MAELANADIVRINPETLDMVISSQVRILSWLQKLYNMKEKIENRLKELYDEYNRVTDKNRVWIKQTGGLTRKEQIEKCKILIEELETLNS